METRELKHMLEGFVAKLSRKEGREGAPSTGHLLELNGPAPDFTARSTHGEIELSKWAGDDWTILFSHPADFTPVCTTEFIEFARRNDEFRRRNIKLLAISIDSVYAHIAWTRNMKERFGVEIPFPVVADLDQSVARLYGMIHEPSSNTETVRALFFIDPKRRIRAMIYYPLNVGRNMDEVLRVADALQMVDEHGLAAPANWQPGDAAIVPPPKTIGEAEERLHEGGLEVTDWYFSKKRL